MKEINIINREMTSEEIKQMDLGFDQLSLEEGVELESSERISFVALNGKTFIGCSSGLAYKNGEKYSGWFYLKDLFVEKEYRSKGLGTELLKGMEKHLLTLGLKHIFLWTSGDEALKFYKRHEYRKFIEMENWYSDGSCRVGLKKSL